MATRVLLHLGDATNRCIFSNVQLHRTKFQVQNILKQTRDFRKIRSKEIARSPFEYVAVQTVEQTNSSKLLKSILFATSFSGAAFIGATILEYERIRSHALNAFNKFSFSRSFNNNGVGWREQARSMWNGLTEGQRTFYFICYANVLVFLAWKVPKFNPVMLKYFATNPINNVNYTSMLLSTFSHYNLWHLAANMYVLHSFSTAAVAYLGREHFLAVYLSSGVFAGALSNIYKILLNRHGFSLGASGAIMGVLAFVCCQYPDIQLNIILLPQFTFAAATAIKSIMAFDTAGCILRWQFFDHAAHLGGALFGLFWQKWGVENIWRKRTPLLNYWHELRNPAKSR